MGETSPPVLQPVPAQAGAPPRAPRAVLVLVAGLGLCAAAFAWVSALSPPAPPSPPAPRPLPPPFVVPVAPRAARGYGPGTEPRARELRDRLARGLVSLRSPDGDYAPGLDDPRQDAVMIRREATAIGLAGLAAARRMGSGVPGLAEALKGVRTALTGRQKVAGGFGSTAKPDRGRGVATISAGILGLLWAGDPADAEPLKRAVMALQSESAVGPLPGAWPRALATRACVALADAAPAGGVDAATVLGWIQADGAPDKIDCGDPRVSLAFARAARTSAVGVDDLPARVLAECSKPSALTWDGDRTDVFSWAMQAWLAARVAGGEAWFRPVFALLEKAPDDAGVLEGTYYGDPVSRTACALLVLAENWDYGSTPPR